MLCINDLIGLPYQWGKRPSEGAVDCFQLHNEIRLRLGLSDQSERFAFAYSQWSEHTFPPSQLLKWLQKECIKSEPREGAIVFISECANKGALGTIVGKNDIVFIHERLRVVRAKVANVGRARVFWID